MGDAEETVVSKASVKMVMKINSFENERCQKCKYR